MPESLRVLLVLASSSGGIGRHVWTLADGLVERGHDVTVCAPEETEARFSFAEGGAHVQAMPVGDIGPRAQLATRQALRHLSATSDVVHAHGARATALATAAQVHPLVSTWHNAPLGNTVRRLVHAMVERAAAHGADATLAASPDLAARARRAGAQAVRFVPVSAPPLGPPQRSAAAVRAELGVGERPIVLAVARLSRQKRLDVLVDAASRWGDRPGAPVVVVAGDGPERERLVAAAERVGAPVRFLGRRDDVADLLWAADVVALPSSWEARPLAAQEALRAGVPLVATAVGGVADLVGDAAVIVPPGDALALRSALERVLRDQSLRQGLVERGQRQSAGWPSVDRMIDMIESAYRDVIAARR